MCAPIAFIERRARVYLRLSILFAPLRVPWSSLVVLLSQYGVKGMAPKEWPFENSGHLSGTQCGKAWPFENSGHLSGTQCGKALKKIHSLSTYRRVAIDASARRRSNCFCTCRHNTSSSSESNTLSTCTTIQTAFHHENRYSCMGEVDCRVF
eukprot:scaffold30128_cov154-Skeletonema_menzelii.AAC.2